MHTVARQLRDIDRTLTRTLLETTSMMAHLTQCPSSQDDTYWNALHLVMRGVSGVLADQDRLLDLRLDLGSR
jgi:hypothetical protein